MHINSYGHYTSITIYVHIPTMHEIFANVCNNAAKHYNSEANIN